MKWTAGRRNALVVAVLFVALLAAFPIIGGIDQADRSQVLGSTATTGDSPGLSPTAAAQVTTTQTAAPWPGQAGGPDNWIATTDGDGFIIRNAVTGQNLQWIRMSSGERPTGTRGTLPTSQLSADSNNIFFRLRTLGPVYRSDTNQWQNQGFHQVAIGADTNNDGQFTTQAFIGMHVNANGRVFIRDAQTGTETTVYAGNTDINQAQGVRSVLANNGNENPAYWTDVQVPISAIESATNGRVTGNTDVRLFFGTATQSNTINFDTQNNVREINYNNLVTTSFNSLREDFEDNAIVTLNSPANGERITTSRPTISGTADAPSGSTLRIYVDGQLVRTISNVGASWSYQLTESQALSDGEHRVRAELTTQSGQVATTSTNTFTVDTVAPPQITTERLNTWTVDQAGYNQQLSATGGTGSNTFAVAGGSLPNGLALSPDGRISGTPTQAGTFEVTVRVTDSVGRTSTRSYTLTINERPRITSPSSLTAGVEDVPYSQQLTATGGTAPLTFEVIGGELPPGLSLSDQGAITGEPNEAGTYTFTARVTDATGATTTKEFTIVVRDGLTITTTALPEWTTGQDGYSTTLQSAGGTGDVTWRIVGGSLPDGVSLDSTTGEISGQPSASGTSTFTVEAEDADGTIVQRSLSIVVNDRPTIDEPADLRDGVEGVSYSQSLYVPGGTAPLTFEVSDGALPPGLTIDDDTGRISGVPETGSAGTYTFTIQVTDASGAVETREYTIDIRDSLAIETEGIPAWTVDQDGFTATVDMSGGTEPYTWSISEGALPNGLSLNADTGEISGTPTQAGTFQITVAVEDADGTVVEQAYTVVVNEAPTFTTDSGLDRGVEGVFYFETLAVEGGTAPRTWELVDGELPEGIELTENGDVQGTPADGSAGTYTFTARVTDGTGASTDRTFTIVIGDGLTITTSDLPQWTVGQQIGNESADTGSPEFRIEVAGGTEPYNWTITDGALPNGLTLDDDGFVVGTPTETGTFTFTVTVTDADGTAVSREYTLVINEEPTVATPADLPGAVQDVSYSEQLAVDNGTGPFTWRLAENETLPAGLTLSEDGLISGTPTEAGTFPFTVEAVDAAGATTSREFTIVVRDGLVVDSDALADWTVDQPGYDQRLEATGGTEPYRWQVSGLPDGLRFDADTGEITGTPEQVGTFTVTATVTDADGTQATREFEITINKELALTSPAELPRVAENVEYEERLEFAGGTGNLTWSISEGALPNGLSLNADTGEISGTPTQAGTYTFTVEVTDETGSTTTKEFVLVVGDGLTVTSSTALTGWTVDRPGYAVGIDVVGGTEPYTWELTGGTLPDGLQLDEQTGAITGTPTASGTFTFEVTVTDEDDTAVTRQFTITIAESVEITSPDALPTGVEGVSYSVQLESDGGTEPIVWRVEAGELPPGLTLGADGELDGVISGVPELADTYTFTVSATDAAGSTTAKTFTIEITDRLRVETTELDAWTVGQDGYSDQLQATGGTGPYRWEATGLPDGLTLDPETGEISGTPEQPGTFTVRATVTDADGTQVTRQFTITVNDDPELTSDEELRGGVEGVLYGEQLALDGGTGPFTWTVTAGDLPPGLELDGETGEISGTPDAGSAGSYAFTVEVVDSTGATASQTFTIVVGDGLTLTTATLDEWTVDRPGYSQVVGANGGTGAYTWTIADGDTLPDGLTLNPETGIISGTPGESGEFTFTVEVTDADGTTVSREYTLVINDAPSITTTELPDPTERVAYSEQLAFEGGTGPFSWEIVDGALPAGLTLDPETGLISGTPEESGEFTLTVEVTDSTGATATQAYTFNVGAGLTIDTRDLPEWTVGQAITDPAADGFRIDVDGGTEDYAWAVTSGALPPGLTLNETTGEITGTPTQAGTFTFEVTVTDADGTQVTRQFTVTINGELTVTSPGTLSSGVEGVEYEERLAFTGGTGTLSWAVTEGDLPPGLDLSEDGVISGTPSDGAAGTYTFTVEATDEAGATVTQTFTITIGDGLTVTTTTLPEWTAGQSAYAGVLEAAGGTGPYEWSITGGEFPDGLTLDPSTGLITGAPTDAGTYAFTVAVTDADGTVVTRDIVLVVNERPEITSPSQLSGGAAGVTYGEQLTLDGGTEPVEWSVIGGDLPPGVTLSDDGLLSGVPTAPGTYSFTVQVTDEAGATTTKEFVLTVRDGLAFETMELDAWTVGQDGFEQTVAITGGTAPYSWAATGLPEGLTLDPETGQIAGEPTQTGTFTVTVTVIDGDGTEITRAFTLVINDELELTSPEGLSRAVEGVTYDEQLEFTGGTGPYTWEVIDGDLPPGLELDPETGQIRGTPTEAGTYTFTVQTTDATGATVTQQFTIVVGDGLTLTTATLAEWTVDRPGYSQLLEASGGTLPYTWSAAGLPNGLTLDEETGIISGEPDETGTFDVTITVTDADGTTDERTVQVVVNDPPAQPAPEDLPDPVEGVAYSEQLTVDGGTGPFAWQVSDGALPPGLELDPDTGLISGTPTEAGEFTFTVEATDVTGATTTREYTVTVGDGLAMETAALPDWTVGEAYDEGVDVVGGTEAYAWDVTSGALPPGLTLNETTGEVTGTPTDPGSYTFTVTVIDADGTQVARSFTVVISEQPTITSPEDLSRAVEGVAYSEQLAFDGGTGPYTWTISDGDLPPGLGLDEDTGVITGTPTEAGTYTFDVTVTDAAGATTTKQFTIVVGDGLTLATSTLPEWTVDQDGYSEQLVAAGGTAPYAFEIAGGALPDGLTLHEGTGAIYGTPTQAGTFTFEVTVTDADGTTDTREVTLVINGPLDLTSPDVLSSGVEGVSYSEQLAFDGGTGPYAWTVSDGALPPGLSLDPDTGVLSGVPSEPGTYVFTVRVTDSTGATVEETYTLTVGDGLTITTSTLPEWTVGQSGYDAQLAAAGGTGGDISWSVVGESLPDGLSLDSDGSITGTPGATGEFTFTVEADQADGTTVTRQLSIVINEEPAISTTELPALVEGVTYSEQVAFTGGTGPYTWTITDGELPAGLSLDPDTGVISGTPTEAGTFEFTVQVEDAAGTTATRMYSGTVGDRLAFDTEALDAWTVDRDGYSTFIGMAGGTEPYRWEASGLPDGLNLNSNTGEIAGTPTQTGTFTVTVTVTDADGTAVSREFDLTINDGLAITSSEELPRAVENVQYDGQLGFEGGTGEITWALIGGELPAGLELNETTGAISGTPDAAAAGTYTFTVEATDGTTGETVRKQFTLVVGDGLTITTTELPEWTTGQDGYSTTLQWAGGTGDVTWSVVGATSLPNGLNLDSNTGEISGEPTESGTFTITVEAEDGDGSTVRRTFTIVINEEPTITSPDTLTSGVEGVAYSQQLSVGDGTGPFTWAVTEGDLPPGLELSADGLISGTPTTAGSYTFTVEVTDQAGATTVRDITIEVTPGLAAVTGGLSEWTVDEDGYSATLQAVGGTEPYRWEAAGLPDGLQLNAGTGEITGTPTQTGTFTVTVAVTDADGSTSTQQLTLVVNEQPEITSPSALSAGVEGVAYSEQLAFGGGTGPYTWEVSSGTLPPGLTLDENGIITGVPEAAGTYEFTVTVTDATGATSERTFTLIVGDGLTLTTSTLPEWTVDAPGYSQTLVPAGGTGPYAFEITGDALPDGLTLDEGTGTISGTPTEAGQFTFEVTVTDADGTEVTRTLTLVINEAATITSPAELETGVERVAYSQQLTAEEGTGPLSWTVSNGSLPPGLSLSGDGLISGTPTASGTYAFDVTVTDAAGVTTTETITIEITDGLAIESGSLGSWTVGQEGYSDQLQATGGTEPYRWSVVGGLPEGLALDPATGEISGTPTQTGTFTVTVAVTDADGSMSTQQLTLVVNEQPEITSPSALSAGVEGVAYSEQLAFEGGTGDVTWEVVSGQVPPGLSLDPETGQLSGEPTEAGTYTFTVEATDETGATTTTEFTIVVGDGLTVTTSTLPEWTVNEGGFDEQLVAAGGTAPYNWTVTDGPLPDGLALSEDGRITGTPTQTGTFTVTVEVEDGDGTTVRRTLTLVINGQPVIEAATLPAGTERVTYSQQLFAGDGTAPLTWSLADGELPPGVTLDENGRISGTPTAAGTYEFTVRATDATGATTTETFIIEVGDGLTAATGDLPAWTVDEEGYSASLAASGGTEPYRWSAIGGLPDGLTLDPTGEITGTPTQTGTFTVTVEATDADGTAVQETLTLRINDRPALTAPADLSAGVEGVDYSQRLTFEGGTGPYTWTVVSGQLPPGLELDTETGQVSGTPTAAGTHAFTVAVTDSTGATTTKGFTITVTDGLTVASTTLPEWTLDRAGYDEQLVAAGGTAPYGWTVTDGALPDGVALSEDGRITGTPTEAGTFEFTVTVTDADGTEVTRTLTLVINKAATITSPAELETGVERVAYSQQLTAEEGTGPLSWTVSNGSLPPGLTLDPDTGLVTGTPTASGTYAFDVTVTDATGVTTTETITIEITDGLAIETFELAPWTVGQDGYSAQLQATGGTEPYRWSVIGGLPDGLSLEPNTGEITGEPTQNGVFSVTVAVTDADGTEVVRERTLVVNDRPAITSPEDLSRAVEGVAYSEQLTVAGGTEPVSWTRTDGDDLPDGLTLNSTTGTISGTPEGGTAGTYTFTVQLEDEAGATTTKQFTIVVGDGLTVTTSTLPEWTVNQSGYDRQLVAAGGTAPYNWTVTDGTLPPGLTLSEDGRFSGTPAESGTFTFDVTVTDADDTEVTRTLTLVVNGGPTIEDATLPDGTERVAYGQRLTVANGTGPFAWAVAGGEVPPGLTLTPEGLLTGTPTASGTYSFTVRVTDASGSVTTREVTVDIREGLAQTTSRLDAWTVDQPGYQQELEATGGTEPYSWTVVAGALPDGLTLDETTGEITGTPEQEGTFAVTVAVTDADETTVTREFILSVNPQPAVVSPTEISRAVEGVAYDERLLAEGGTEPLTWSIAGGALPPGLELSESGAISGTPSDGAAGTYTLTVAITDATGATTTQEITIVVGEGLTVSTVTLPEWTVGQAGYSEVIAGSGGTEPYSWSVDPADLPPGLAFDADTGAISGTPTAPGTYTIQVTVTDADGSTSTRDVTLVINDPPSITSPSELPEATFGESYSQQLTSEAGTGPVTWSIVSGQLPAGLTLDPNTGIISGTPTQSGTFTVTVEVTDSAGVTSRTDLTIRVPSLPSSPGTSPTDDPVSPDDDPVSPDDDSEQPADDPESPGDEPQETVEDVPISELGNLTVVDARLETEPVNSIRATSFISLRNEGSAPREVTIEFRINRETVGTETQTIAGGDTREFDDVTVLTEPGTYRFSFVVVTEEDDGVERRQVRTSDQDLGDVTIEDGAAAECELFGISLGAFGVCWYWWVLVDAIIATLLTYAVQTRREGVRPLFDTPDAERDDRFSFAFVRLGAFSFGVAVVSLAALWLLWSLGLTGASQFLPVLALILVLGAVAGKKQFPPLDPADGSVDSQSGGAGGNDGRSTDETVPVESEGASEGADDRAIGDITDSNDDDTPPR